MIASEISAIFSACVAAGALFIAWKAHKMNEAKNLPSVWATTEIHGADFCLCVYNFSSSPIENVKITYPKIFYSTSPENHSGTFGLPESGFHIGIIPPNMKFITPFLVYARDHVPDHVREHHDKMHFFRKQGEVNVSFYLEGKFFDKWMKVRDIGGITISKNGKESRVLAPADYQFES